ncbi:MAG: histidinol dehydrogenase [Clostridia bacterium]|nr:histidinol dehydrogenase [Clostridia bacterium]
MIEITDDYQRVVDKIALRQQLDDCIVIDAVTAIMNDVRKNKDQALKKLTKQFDNTVIEAIEITEEQIRKAYDDIDEQFLGIIRKSIMNVKEYHEKQVFESWSWQKEKGITLGQKVTPLEKVGIYVPGGTAPLVSSVIMNAVPAKVAGVKSVIMCTPPPIDSGRIVAAVESGVDAIYQVGGAQAIFAMAFGTETISKVDKITGPGNIYVANAKKMVYGFCNIDMIAGPSEIMIIADEKSNVQYIAADLLSQAEHDERAAVILATTDDQIAKKVNDELIRQTKNLKRKAVIKKSINDYGIIYVNSNMEELVMLANEIAPEHLELLTENNDTISQKIRNAGAIFMGEYSPEPLGDYFAGPNHTLPTGGTARFYSPLGTYDFIKRTSLIEYDRSSLLKVYEDIASFADFEQLDAHANAVKIRFGESE